MPFPTPTPAEVAATISDGLETALTPLAGQPVDARSARSVLAVLARATAGGIYPLHLFARWLAEQILPDTAEAEWLARHTALWGVVPVAATAATGTVRLSGVPGTTLAAGAEAVIGGRVYVLPADTTIGPGGVADATLVAHAAGAGGNQPPGARGAWTATQAGIDAALVVLDDGSGAGLGGGADQEDTETWRARLLARIQRPPHGGAVHDYEAWVRQVIPDARVWVTPGAPGVGLGAGTVLLHVALPDATLPDGATIAAVQAHLDVERPVTAQVSVVAPVAVPLAVAISALGPDSAAVRAAVETAVAAFIAAEASPGGTLEVSRLRAAISNAPGVITYTLVAPAPGVETVTAAPGHMHVYGGVTWL